MGRRAFETGMAYVRFRTAKRSRAILPQELFLAVDPARLIGCRVPGALLVVRPYRPVVQGCHLSVHGRPRRLPAPRVWRAYHDLSVDQLCYTWEVPAAAVDALFARASGAAALLAGFVRRSPNRPRKVRSSRTLRAPVFSLPSDDEAV